MINLFLTSITLSAGAEGMFCSFHIMSLSLSLQKTIFRADKPLRNVNAECLEGFISYK